MRSVKFIISFFSTFFKRFNLILVFGVLFGVLGFIAVRIAIVKIKPASVSYIGVVGKFKTENLPPFLLEMISEGLTKIDAQGNPQPSIAKSWKAIDAGKTWEFIIDTNKTWQDGTNIKSQDLQFSFEDVSIERPNEQTLLFHLKSPYAPFASVLSRPVFKKGLLGTGLWSVTKVSQLGSYVEKIELKDALNNRILSRFYPDEEKAKLGFEMGQVDKLLDLSLVEPFNKWTSVAISEQKQDLRYIGVFFDNKNSLFKDNKALRQALAYAIEKSEWKENRAISPVPSMSWAYNSQVKPYDYDINRAKELLRPIIKKDERLKIKLATVSSLISVADKIAKDWEQVGVSTDVTVTTEIPDSFDALLIEYDVSLDPDQYLTWHSTQSQTNISHYTNPRIDKLLEDGRLEMNPENRKKIYLDFQRFLLEDVPAVFLYHPVSFTVTRK